MTEKQRNIILLSHVLAELKKNHGLSPNDIINNYNKEKVFNLMDSLFPNSICKDNMVELSNELYRKLKIK